MLRTPHGDIQTPAFMPVGTAGAVKGITPQQLKKTGAEIVLANTYHLMLRPGVDVVEQLGGLHQFMSWDGPILTDSGGYQIFSLACPFEDAPPNDDSPRPLTKVDDDGVEFTSHIDGAKIYLDAETATQIQNRLGADIIMCFDQCPSHPSDDLQLQKAVERTINWAKLCKESHSNAKQMLFGIVQGGTDQALREKCTKELIKLGFDGYAIGGLSVGEGREDMLTTIEDTVELLPEDKPRYLMGVGMPAEIIAAVRDGVDMFDCVLPTRNGRNAYAFTGKRPVRVRNSSLISDAEAIEQDCDCYCCKNFSRGAIRHFFNIGEMLGPILVSLHNLRFFQRLMTEIRQAIEKKEFKKWSEEQLNKMVIDY